jgi:hypothetical protein
MEYSYKEVQTLVERYVKRMLEQCRDVEDSYAFLTGALMAKLTLALLEVEGCVAKSGRIAFGEQLKILLEADPGICTECGCNKGINKDGYCPECWEGMGEEN